jgi:hypothetical protein
MRRLHAPGIIEACIVIAASGSTLLIVGAALGWGNIPPHAQDPGWWSVLLGVTVITATISLLWGSLGLFVPPARSLRAIARHLASRLPFELRSPIVRRLPTAPPPDAPLGFLDFQLAWENALERLARITGRLAKNQFRGLKLAQTFTPRFVAHQSASTRAQVSVARDYGRQLDRVTRDLVDIERDLRESSRQLSDNLLARLRTAPPANDVSVFAPIIASIRDSTIGGRDGMTAYRDAVIGMRSGTLQQALNSATDSLAAVVNRVIEDYDVIIRCGDDALAMIAARPMPPT